MIAVVKGRVLVVEYLVKRGADVEAKAQVRDDTTDLRSCMSHKIVLTRTETPRCYLRSKKAMYS